MAELTMPSLGADMEDGTLVEWRIKPGDAVQRGEVVAEVETDKGLIEIEIWENGVVDELRVLPGAKVPVGAVLATIAPSRASTPATVAPAPPVITPVTVVAPPPELVPPPAAAPPRPEPAPARADGPPPAPPAGAPPPGGPLGAPASRPAASPSARRLARELEVSLERVHGTGPHGAITREDVQRAHDERASAPRAPVQSEPAQAETPSAPELPSPGRAPSAQRPPARAEAAAAMRRAIAAAMARSKREIPHYYLAHEIDVSRATAWLEAENQRRPLAERLLLAALLLKATALAARDFGTMNGYCIDGVFQPAAAVHIGVGVALRQGGLVAPAIHDVDRLSLGQLMPRLADLVQRARGGGLRSSELTDATLTVTNLGDQGADSVFGIIYPPQVALVGFGKPKLKPWAEGGMLGIRPIVTATLAADHRVSDGHTGARFLNAIAQRLAEPEKL